MTEYWLQKKTIGGWSHVTWYDGYEQAKFNFDNVSKGLSGYSWRIVKAETVEEKLLEDHTPVEAPNTKLEEAKSNVWAGNEARKPSSNGWSDTANGWNSNVSVNVTTRNQPWDAGKEAVAKEHALAGKVWLIHHGKKEKGRFAPEDVDAMIAEGWERGGPRTQFK